MGSAEKKKDRRRSRKSGGDDNDGPKSPPAISTATEPIPVEARDEIEPTSNNSKQKVGKRKRKSKGEPDVRTTKKSKSEPVPQAIEDTPIHAVGKSSSTSKSQLRRLKKSKPLESKSPNNKRSSATPKKRTGSLWSFSGQVGGRYLAIDPQFSLDERYFFLASRTSLLVYSASSSLLYRKVDLANHGFIASFCVSSDTSIFVGTRSGKIVELDWSKGKVIAERKFGGIIRSIATSSPADGSLTVLDFVEEFTDTESRISRASWNSTEETKQLLKISGTISRVQTLGNGRVLVASAEEHVYVATQKQSTGEANYTWYQVHSTERIVSFDARIQDAGTLSLRNDTPKKNKTKAKATDVAVDLAIGNSKGIIHVYENVLSQLAALEKKAGADSNPSPRTLHWHRGPVNSVKWSLDGNYLISGGNETTLIMWQLRTGKRETLPHLTAAIDCLTVSPSGTSYAAQLADNSLIVLSTSELQATSQVSGLQCLVGPRDEKQTLSTTTVLHRQMAAQDRFDPSVDASVTIHPLKPNLLLLAVPASQPKSEPFEFVISKPFLQTFDLASSHSVAKQAMTRNFTTDPNMGPEKNRLIEPDVKLMRISHDGQWLATLEEWLPPKSDLDYLRDENVVMRRERLLRLETSLKFWLWDDECQVWMLEARIDSPHISEDGITPARVFNLEADPSRNEFATAGEDGVVRVWGAKTRLRNNLVVRGTKGEGMTTWALRRAVELPSPVDETDDDYARKPIPSVSRLAYSAEGSILAVANEYAAHAESGIVRLIDAHTGAIAQSRSDMFTTGLAGLGFIGRYLAILSDSLAVWDLVDDRLQYSYKLHDVSAQRHLSRHFAPNSISGTFAIAVPVSGSPKSYKLAIFDPNIARPVFVSPQMDTVTGLLAVPGSSRYLMLNDHAEACTVGHWASKAAPLIKEAAALGEAVHMDAEPISAADADDAFRLAERDDEVEDDDDDEPVADVDVAGSLDPAERGVQELMAKYPSGSRPLAEWDDLAPREHEEQEVEFRNVPRQHRAELFAEYPSSALPDGRVMFEKVWDLYVLKAKTVELLNGAG